MIDNYYGKEIGKNALTNNPSHKGFSCRFSIFYCGCKQPKSIHILFSCAKVAHHFELYKFF